MNAEPTDPTKSDPKSFLDDVFIRAGGSMLAPTAQTWLIDRLSRYEGTEAASFNNPAGLRCPLPGYHTAHEDRCFNIVPEGARCVGTFLAKFNTPMEGARVAVLTAQRVAVGPGQASAPDLYYPPRQTFAVGWVPGFGPTDDIVKTVAMLRADFAAYEREGIGTKLAPEMKPRMKEIRDFFQAWDKCSNSFTGCDEIAASDIGGKVIAAVSDSNTIRSILRDAGKKGYDRSEDRKLGSDVVDVTNFGKDFAKPIVKEIEKAGGPIAWFTGDNALRNIQILGGAITLVLGTVGIVYVVKTVRGPK